MSGFQAISAAEILCEEIPDWRRTCMKGFQVAKKRPGKDFKPVSRNENGPCPARSGFLRHSHCTPQRSFLPRLSPYAPPTNARRVNNETIIALPRPDAFSECLAWQGLSPPHLSAN
jgi:hypothetical protein